MNKNTSKKQKNIEGHGAENKKYT